MLKTNNEMHLTLYLLEPSNAIFHSIKGAQGNFFNLIKPFRNHLNGSITCSGENGVPRRKNNLATSWK